ncbi:YbaB/EbfC family nucleoid-associated protein [Goodfellowiella coeruleoviolacea]|uniref:YbaB/EbfC family nucleoid-associated protein n=1 Tax=Goodfellowiella coeruleoviolacea TaxID=334858 RepID=A0AAE3GMJ9_9PSEU|nr:YbaB/EbfC family nucleoid-associated protein [Goodfellowiella coeruleoviolacea]MCP2170159.1 hypothetical protein [Goodfellowiella coeruleoviolacea]
MHPEFDNRVPPVAPEAEIEEMMARLQRRQQEIAQIQRGVDAMLVKGFSRASEVTATVRGTGRLVEISIDPVTVRRHDAHDIGAIVTEAVNDALDRLAAATQARFAPVLADGQDSFTAR